MYDFGDAIFFNEADDEIHVTGIALLALSETALLFISANTAANHVRSILAKTEAPNRTKAAIFAAAHDLLGPRER